MRALLSIAPGGPTTLIMTDCALPSCGPDEVRIRVGAVSINYPDALIISDRYQFKPERPFSPGSEVSGIIDAVGRDVSGFQPGMRVAAIMTHGALAEYVCVPSVKVVPLPAGLPLEQAAGLLLTYGTSLYALTDRGQLKAGQRLLVLGAAGGIGTATIELGKAFGAHVVAGVSDEQKADLAMAAGADQTFIYPRAPFDAEAAKKLRIELKALGGADGFDVIVDPIGGPYAEPALRAIRWEGRYLVIGFTAGIAAVPMNLILLKSCQMAGVFWGAFIDRSPDALRLQAQELFSLYSGGRIAPLISERYPFEKAGQAIAHVADRRALGKVIVQVDASLI
jgi:NADPH2:quinone reductase